MSNQIAMLYRFYLKRFWLKFSFYKIRKVWIWQVSIAKFLNKMPTLHCSWQVRKYCQFDALPTQGSSPVTPRTIRTLDNRFPHPLLSQNLLILHLREFEMVYRLAPLCCSVVSGRP